MGFLDRLRIRKSKKVQNSWDPVIGDQVMLTENCLRLKLREAGKAYVRPGAIGKIVNWYDFTLPLPKNRAESDAHALLTMTKSTDAFVKIISTGMRNANKVFYDIEIDGYTARDMPRYVDGSEVFVRVEYG